MKKIASIRTLLSFILFSFSCCLYSMELVEFNDSTECDGTISILRENNSRQKQENGHYAIKSSHLAIEKNMGIPSNQIYPLVDVCIKLHDRPFCECPELPLSCLLTLKNNDVIKINKLSVMGVGERTVTLRCINSYDPEESFQQSLRAEMLCFGQRWLHYAAFNQDCISGSPQYCQQLISELVEADIINANSDNKTYTWGKNGFPAMLITVDPLFKQCWTRSLLLLCCLHQLEK